MTKKNIGKLVQENRLPIVASVGGENQPSAESLIRGDLPKEGFPSKGEYAFMQFSDGGGFFETPYLRMVGKTDDTLHELALYNLFMQENEVLEGKERSLQPDEKDLYANFKVMGSGHCYIDPTKKSAIFYEGKEMIGNVNEGNLRVVERVLNEHYSLGWTFKTE